jgi:predicted RNA methylase
MPDGPAWESSDQAYMCLRDRRRTRLLRRAIAAQVRPGDHVADLGAGSGVLSLFAAQAGARSVLAIEGDPVLARTIERCARANGFGRIIDVVEGDARDLRFSEPADVVICELMETGLIGETLVPVLNAVLSSGLINGSTRFVPSAYETYLQPMAASHKMYGLWMPVIRHDWSFFAADEWLRLPPLRSGSVPQRVWGARFSDRLIDQRVVARVPLGPGEDSLRITGKVQLAADRWHGDFPSMNGPKLIPLPDEVIGTQEVAVAYTMGEGLASLELRAVA